MISSKIDGDSDTSQRRQYMAYKLRYLQKKIVSTNRSANLMFSP